MLAWFAQHLAKPPRFNRSRSKGYLCRTSKGIAWLRHTAVDHISRMYDLKRIAEANGHTVRVLSEDRVGYVAYEDEFQVIAEPFADTQTRE